MKFYKNKDWLRRQYVTEGKSVTQIAKEQGVSHQTIYRHLVQFGLIKQARSWK